MMVTKNKKHILLINNHTLQRINERTLMDLKKVFETQDTFKTIKVLQSKFNKHIVKEALVIGKNIIICSVFERGNKVYYKTLSLIFENQFFCSLNLNFGLHSEFYEVTFDKKTFIDERDKKWFFPESEFREYGEIKWNFNKVEASKFTNSYDVSQKGKTNYILENNTLPFKVKTFSGKVLNLI